MKRFRDFRKDQATRDKYADVSLSAADFIYPYFVVEGENQKKRKYGIIITIENIKE